MYVNNRFWRRAEAAEFVQPDPPSKHDGAPQRCHSGWRLATSKPTPTKSDSGISPRLRHRSEGWSPSTEACAISKRSKRPLWIGGNMPNPAACTLTNARSCYPCRRMGASVCAGGTTVAWVKPGFHRAYGAAEHQARTCSPCFWMTISSFSAMPLGRLAPVSHFSTVLSLVLR